MSIKIHLLEQGWTNFHCKGQTVNILGVSGQTGSVATTGLHLFSREVASENTQRPHANEWAWLGSSKTSKTLKFELHITLMSQNNIFHLIFYNHLKR